MLLILKNGKKKLWTEILLHVVEHVLVYVHYHVAILVEAVAQWLAKIIVEPIVKVDALVALVVVKVIV